MSHPYQFSPIIMTSNKSGPSTTTASSSSLQWPQLCRHFQFGEILSATENFSESLVIGRGGFGKVYKGNIHNGSTIVVAAIKRLDAKSKQGASEFWAEVEMLSNLRHCHLVSLIGYCNHQREMILIYEYMPHGTLADHLHKFGNPLSWSQRLKICIGTARGLDYLHTGTGIKFGIVHRDVKSSNILLDESWEAKVSDFGLSKISPKNQPSTHVSTLVKGTFGYIDPHYFTTGKLTRKSDVYAFGVILLEVLCRKKAVDASLDCGLATWFQDAIKEGHLKDIVDPDISGEISPKCLKMFARIAERCLKKLPKNRPKMAEVVPSLEYVLTLQDKTNNMSPTASKTIFGRMVDKFSYTRRGQNSGLEFEPLLPFPTRARTQRSHFPPIPSHHQFTFVQIEAATNNFDEARVIGVGRFGKVYIGEIDGETKVAIKRASLISEQGVNEFRTELELLSKLRHRHLVSLIGYCEEKTEMILVYEYMAHGSVKDRLYNTQNQPLTWTQRLEICVGAARGLQYLHDFVKDTIVHKDVKTANILLDDKLVAKVCDFGISKLGPHTHDQIHVDPEYCQSRQLTKKSDVYSFGVVVFEILCGRPPVDPTLAGEQVNLAQWVLNCHQKGILDQIVDPYLRGKIPPECFKKVAETAVKCLADCGIDRPSMEEVLRELEYANYQLLKSEDSDSLSLEREESESTFDTSAD